MTRILIVDNKDDNREAYAADVRNAGYEVFQARTPEEAEEVLAKELIHLALIDVRLLNDDDDNDRSGLELCSRIDSSVPRIILSGVSDWQVVRDALAPIEGKEPLAHTFFQKTERHEILLNEIARVLAAEYEVIPDRRIAILTSGGDAPGMNAAIWSALRTALAHGVEVYGVSDGYKGLLDNRIGKLRWRSVADTLTTGGTMLGTARSKEFRDPNKRVAAVDNLLRKHISGLIVIGGDGSMQGAKALAEDIRKKGFELRTVALPGTIDNDLAGTDMSIGAATAVARVMHEIDTMVAPARALGRIFVCEIMGRYSGFLTIEAGLCVGAEALLLPEELVVVKSGHGDKADWEKYVDIGATVNRVLSEVEHVADCLEKAFVAGKRHAFVLFSEGIRYLTTTGATQFINAEIVAERLQAAINRWTYPDKPDVRPQVIGYPMRGGSPSRSDMHLGIELGAAAVEALLNGKTNTMVGWSESTHSITFTPFDEVVRLGNRSPAIKFAERPDWKRTLELQRRLVATMK